MLPDRVLVIDDEPTNTTVLERLLRSWGFTEITTSNDSTTVIELFHSCQPDIILLDLHMPEPNGFEILAMLGDEVKGVVVPILVLTADANSDAKHQALERGAQDFVAKPFDAKEVRLRVMNLLKTRRLELSLHSYGLTLQERVTKRTHELNDARRETLSKLGRVVEFRDDSTGGHIHRVAHTTAQLAKIMGMSEQEIEILALAALLHDIGKVGIPDTVLLKPGRLTEDEFDLMKQHARLGADILEGSNSPVLRSAAKVALTHHEHWDGGGYPSGLAGVDIPFCGRLVAVADVFDALTTKRPYKQAWPLERAVNEIVNQGGCHFDPEVVRAFQQLNAENLTAQRYESNTYI